LNYKSNSFAEGFPRGQIESPRNSQIVSLLKLYEPSKNDLILSNNLRKVYSLFEINPACELGIDCEQGGTDVCDIEVIVYEEEALLLDP